MTTAQNENAPTELLDEKRLCAELGTSRHGHQVAPPGLRPAIPQDPQAGTLPPRRPRRVARIEDNGLGKVA